MFQDLSGAAGPASKPIFGEEYGESAEPISGDEEDGESTVDSNPYPKRVRLSDIRIRSGNGDFIDGLCNKGEAVQIIGAPGGRKSQAAGLLGVRCSHWYGMARSPGCALRSPLRGRRALGRTGQASAGVG